MKNKFFDKLFVFEMANNHMGDVEHGLRIIREIKKACVGFGFQFAFKLQYRQLDSFIHPDYQNRKDIKYVKRFMETKLTEADFLRLKDEVVKAGFIAICTPFDEPSVDLIEKHNYDIIKIGSCSFTDWPLLERIAKTDKPLIASTAGTSIEDIDKVVSFFEHRNKSLALMHCVGEYPTANKNIELNQIDFLRSRYSEVPIGYSTHEDPNNFDNIKIAIAKGAKIFEKHVGIKTDKYGLNAYSASPNQIRQWLKAAESAYEVCGVAGIRRPIMEKEWEDLRGLQRGVFAKKAIRAGEEVDFSNAFLAIPNMRGQLLANDMSKYSKFVAKKAFVANQLVILEQVEMVNLREKVLKIISSIRQILIDSKIFLPNRVEFELSHHYGLEKYEKWGAAIISCINREYCKKIIVLLPGQQHPTHYHIKKEETFQVLFGDVTINIQGEEKDYKPGDIAVIERKVKHSFKSKDGAVFEEVSTTHYVGDSYYDDEKIMANKNRKTEMTFWSDWLTKPVI